MINKELCIGNLGEYFSPLVTSLSYLSIKWKSKWTAVVLVDKFFTLVESLEVLGISRDGLDLPGVANLRAVVLLVVLDEVALLGNLMLSGKMLKVECSWPGRQDRVNRRSVVQKNYLQSSFFLSWRFEIDHRLDMINIALMAESRFLREGG